jgi:hypothetical protein
LDLLICRKIGVIEPAAEIFFGISTDKLSNKQLIILKIQLPLNHCHKKFI